MKFFRKRRNIIWSVIALVAVGIGLYMWYQSTQPKTVQVEQVDVENVQVRESVSASGTVESENSSDLRFLSSGTIATLNVSDGDVVTTGQVLATLDSASAAQSAKAARDARDVALRNRDLFVEQTTDKEAAGGEDSYDIQLRRLNELISQADATYKSQSAALRDLNIRAPFNGTVVEVFKNVGEPVGPSETVIKIAVLSQLYFEVDLDQEDFGLVKLGDQAEIELDAYPDKTFYGTVAELPKYIDADVDTALKVKVALHRADNPILLGMAGDGTIVTSQTPETVQAVPFDAVFEDEDGRTYLWILDNGILKKKYVEVGIVGDAYTEVKDDLSGLTVIIPTDSDIEVVEGDKGQIAKS